MYLGISHNSVVHPSKKHSKNTLKTIVFLLVIINYLIISKKIIFLKTILKTKTRFQRIFLVFILIEQDDILSIVLFPSVQLYLL